MAEESTYRFADNGLLDELAYAEVLGLGDRGMQMAKKEAMKQARVITEVDE